MVRQLATNLGEEVKDYELARIETNIPLDMNSIDTLYGVLTTITQNQITITAGQFQGTYRGSFSFDQFGNVFGQLNSYETRFGGVLETRFSELSVDAFTAFNAINSNNAESLFPDALSGGDSFFGSSFNDILFGFAGDDTMLGGLGSDTLRGDAGADRLEGQGGDDLLSGGAGNDVLDGGTGWDTAVYSGKQSSYTLTLAPGFTGLTDRRMDGSGADAFSNVEFLDFNNGSLDLTKFGGPTTLSQDEFESFIELYIALFNRAPDAKGFNFWGTAFANGTTLEEMTTLFFDQDETRALYPESFTNTEFVEAVYQNVMGRQYDQSGFDFWVPVLDDESNGIDRDTFIYEFLAGVQPNSPDEAYLQSKVDIGAYFAVHKGMSDVEDATTAMQLFDGSQDSINDAVAAIDGFYADALDPNNGEFLMQVVGVLDNTLSTI